MPYTEPWFLGVANLRGGLYGVVQLSAFATGVPGALAATEAARIQSRLVAFNELLEVNCALLVDRLAGLRGAAAITASEPPGAAAPARPGQMFSDPAGERGQEVNLQALSQQPQFLSIGA